MKKFLLATLLAAGGMTTLSAGEISVLFQDEPVANGSTIEFTEFSVTEIDAGEYGKMYSWKVDPELYLLVDEAGPLTVHAKSANGEDFQLCAGGNCIMGDDLIKPEVMPEVNVPLNLQLDWAKSTINEPEIAIPALNINIEIFYNNDPSNVYKITLKMGGFEAAGVESVGNDANNVVLKGNTLYYDLDGANQINVYSLSGKTVLSQPVSGSGSLSLASLSKGIYLYRVSGKTNKTAKIIIK